MSRRRTLLGLLVFAVPLLQAAPPAEKIYPDDEKLLKAAKIATEGPALLDYFRKRTITEKDREKIAGLIRSLGNDSFKVREKASADLLAWGTSALPQLRQALNDPDEEIRERAREGIAAAASKTNPALSAAIVRVLRIRAPAGTVKVLLDYLPNTENDAIADEMMTTLAILGVKENKVDPLFFETLKDKLPLRRAAAALVVGRSGTAEQRRGAQTLLTDADVRVRFRAAQGLLAARDRSAIPAFIALLTDAPQETASRAEEMLSCVAAGRGPRQPITDNAAANRNTRTAWEQWWKMNPKVDLSRADVDLPPFNPTLRARDTARQFAAAFIAADKEKLAKLTKMPFQILGGQTFAKREQLDECVTAWMQNFGAGGGFGGGGVPVTNPMVLGTTTIEEYLKTAQPREQPALLKMQKKNVRIVLMQWPIVLNTPGSMMGKCAVVISVAEEQPHVIGTNFGASGDAQLDGVTR